MNSCGLTCFGFVFVTLAVASAFAWFVESDYATHDSTWGGWERDVYLCPRSWTFVACVSPVVGCLAATGLHLVGKFLGHCLTRHPRPPTICTFRDFLIVGHERPLMAINPLARW
jgi:hypothetical protein